MDEESARDRLVERLRARHDVDPAVFDALRAVPRHEFVPAGRRDAAYEDRPLPIGGNQTVSAPHMVAMICSLIEAGAGDDVLEVGTGCGYHAAVTAELVAPGRVSSVEYDPDLADGARERLDRLGYDAVRVRAGDGRGGWPDHAPYDAAYLACATPAVPDAVVEQVREGGVVVAPVESDGGPFRGGQRLVRLRVRPDGVDREDHGEVRFVRMRGGDGAGD